MQANQAEEEGDTVIPLFSFSTLFKTNRKEIADFDNPLISLFLVLS